MPRRDFDSDLDDMPRRRRHRVKRKQGSNGAVIVICVVAGLMLVGGALIGGYVLFRGKAPAIGGVPGTGMSDLERLAGQWECTFRNADGQIYMHKVKVIQGTTETATWYRPDGSVFRVNWVEFELAVRGQDKVFRYFNGWATDGAGVGQQFPAGEYVYTLDGDTWTEYVTPRETIVWTRLR